MTPLEAAVFDHRQRCWANGYRPLAVWSPDQRVNDEGTPLNSPGKQPRGRWREAAARNPPEATLQSPDPRALNTGLLCGDVVAFDIDVLDQKLADDIVRLIETTLGTTPLDRIGRAPKILLVYRPEHSFTKVQTPELFFPDGSKAKVELLAEGQQFISDGIHPDTGEPYRWTDSSPAETPLAELPLVTEEQARAIIAEAECLLRATGGREKEKPRRERHKANGAAGDFFSQTNTAALADISAWARVLFPRARFEPGTGAWRISSKDLNRDLEEDISIHVDGAWDFGEEIALSPIDLVMRHGRAGTAIEAALWLCDRLAINPVRLGYAGKRQPDRSDKEPVEPLYIVNPTAWQDKTIPPQRWGVPEWIPWGRVTGLYGPAGDGKTLLVQQLMTAMALNKSRLGRRINPVRALGIFCEDDEAELHRRQADINRLYDCDFADLEAMRLVPRLGCENLLMTFGDGRPRLTDFYYQVLEEASDFGAQLLIVDTVADAFGGNQNDPIQARHFVQIGLGGLARAIDGFLIACAHPSKSGQSSGSGEFGSVQWDATFRSRLYLETPKERDEDPDPYVRTLTRKKANYAPRSETIPLCWKDGVLINTDKIGIVGSIERRTCERVFLESLIPLRPAAQNVVAARAGS